MLLNRLYITNPNKIIFDFILKGHIVVVDGLSGSGKTFLANTIRTKQLNDYAKDNDNETDLASVVVINLYDKDIFNQIKSQSSKLFIIDNADIILNQEMADYISRDIKNQYLIYSRSNLEFNISPNYYAHIVKNGNKYTLQYNYAEEGWF